MPDCGFRGRGGLRPTTSSRQADADATTRPGRPGRQWHDRLRSPYARAGPRRREGRAGHVPERSRLRPVTERQPTVGTPLRQGLWAWPVVRRGELIDAACAVIAPLLPEPGSRSGRWRDHRQVFNGILWKLRTGAPWRDVSERYGPWKTCHERLRRWTADGTWDGILAAAQVYDDAQPVEWVISVDSSIVRAHQHSAGARKKGSTGIGRGADPAVGAQIGEAIGRSRGGLSTKIHLAVDGPGRPLSILLTPRTGRRQPAAAAGAGSDPDRPARAWRATQAAGHATADLRQGPLQAA